MEQKCKECDELQMSIFTISGADPTYGMDDLTIRYASRAIKKNTYSAALWFPGIIFVRPACVGDIIMQHLHFCNMSKCLDDEKRYPVRLHPNDYRLMMLDKI